MRFEFRTALAPEGQEAGASGNSAKAASSTRALAVHTGVVIDERQLFEACEGSAACFREARRIGEGKLPQHGGKVDVDRIDVVPVRRLVGAGPAAVGRKKMVQRVEARNSAADAMGKVCQLPQCREIADALARHVAQRIEVRGKAVNTVPLCNVFRNEALSGAHQNVACVHVSPEAGSALRPELHVQARRGGTSSTSSSPSSSVRTMRRWRSVFRQESHFACLCNDGSRLGEQLMRAVNVVRARDRESQRCEQGALRVPGSRGGACHRLPTIRGRSRCRREVSDLAIGNARRADALLCEDRNRGGRHVRTLGGTEQPCPAVRLAAGNGKDRGSAAAVEDQRQPLVSGGEEEAQHIDAGLVPCHGTAIGAEPFCVRKTVSPPAPLLSGSGLRRRGWSARRNSASAAVKPMRRWSAVSQSSQCEGIVLGIGIVVAHLAAPELVSRGQHGRAA